MFLGHYALALAAKRVAPRTSLGVLFAAAQLPDLLWPLFLILGWERIGPGTHGFLAVTFTYYPRSHSLLMVVVWSLVAALIYFAITRNRTGCVVVALLGVSHWVLDYVTHLPDLPLYPGGPLVGLGLWKAMTATVLIEGVMWLVGIAMYVRATRSTGRAGTYGFWILLVILTAIYASSIMSPPPSDLRAVGWMALTGWLAPVWAAWADSHRKMIPISTWQ